MNKLSAALAAASCVIALNLGPAKADIITFNVSATMVAANGVASCAVTCTLGGTIQIDTTLGTTLQANITMSGETPAVGTFNIVLNFIPGTGQLIKDNLNDVLVLDITSLIGYAGGALGSGTVVNSPSLVNPIFSYQLSSGSLTAQPAAVPGPIAGAGVPGLIAACAGFIAWRRRRKTATAH